MEKRGLLVTIEGIDGAGKTTQAKRLVERLNNSGRPAVYLREPTAGKWGQMIRAEYHNPHRDPEKELEWFILDRRDDVSENILPAMENGKIAVLDRYFYSNMAYQGAVGIDPWRIRELNREFPAPDIAIYVKIEPEEALARVGARGEPLNAKFETIANLMAVKKIFDDIARKEKNVIIIDGTGSEQDIADKIFAELTAHARGSGRF